MKSIDETSESNQRPTKCVSAFSPTPPTWKLHTSIANRKSSSLKPSSSEKPLSTKATSPIRSFSMNTISTNPLIASQNSIPHAYENVLDCVLKVFCTHCEPNYELPWSMTPQRQATSSAFIIHGRRILTNAHSVEHYTSVRVKKRDCETKFEAKVVAIGNECDIALLQVDDEEFWSDFNMDSSEESTTPYLSPGSLPRLQDPVMVVGYPSPGHQISVTAGVTSRVEMLHYVHGQGELLSVQIDAAINPGNSGGPVFNSNYEVIGIAFQSVDPSEADSVGYFIPYCVVQHFLDDISLHSRYTGFPHRGFEWQRMENQYLREALGMKSTQSGILVKSVVETSDASRALKRGDIITQIDSISISNTGTIPFRPGENIGLDFLVTNKFVGNSLSIRVIRDGEVVDESYSLSGMEDHRLVPTHDARHLYRRQPEYMIYGGMVFQSLSVPYLKTVYGDDWRYEAPVRLIEKYYRGFRTKSGRSEVVVLAQILAAGTTNGYEEEDNTEVVIITKLNNQPINNLIHLAELIDNCPADVRSLCFEADDNEIFIIGREAAAAEEKKILTTYCIPHARALGFANS